MNKVRKNSYGIGLAYFWKEYKKKVRNKNLFNIDRSTYKNILCEINKKAMEILIKNNSILFLPYGLGNLCITKEKPKLTDITNLPIDWKASRKYGTKIRMTNSHTNMNIMRFYWDKTTVTVKKHRHYKFVASRNNKRALAHEIKQNSNLNYNGI